MNCFIHTHREATVVKNVPCAPGGKLHICAECDLPENQKATFEEYFRRHHKRVKVFSGKSEGN